MSETKQKILDVSLDLFAQKWLFSGELTDENKDIFRNNAYQHIQMFFAELGGQNE